MRRDFLIVHIARWQDGSWLGLDDAALLISCAEAGLVLVAFDRATLPWLAGQVVRAGEDHGGLILFRRGVRSTDYGEPARLVTDFWLREGPNWDWRNRIVYSQKSSVTPLISIVGDADPCAVVDESEPRLTESSLARSRLETAWELLFPHCYPGA